MIGRLRGELVSKQPPFLLVEVQGVGYEIEAPLSTFYNLPEPGGQSPCTLTCTCARTPTCSTALAANPSAACSAA
jgi:Holliday junction resolvasome RuvABC DNA-binding subunit